MKHKITALPSEEQKFQATKASDTLSLLYI